jgi:hypothetical protein
MLPSCEGSSAIDESTLQRKAYALDVVSGDLVQTAPRSHPDRAVCCLLDGDDLFVGNARCARNRVKLAVSITHETRDGSDPQSVVVRSSHSQDRAVLNPRGIGMIENAKMLSVETDEPLVRCQPEVSITRLSEAAHGAMWESLLDGPAAPHVLLDLAIGGQRGQAGGREDDARRREHETQSGGRQPQVELFRLTVERSAAEVNGGEARVKIGGL